MKLKNINKSSSLPAEISIVRQSDKICLAIWIISFIACFYLFYYVEDCNHIQIWVLPFVTVGFFSMIFNKNFFLLLIAVAISIGVISIVQRDFFYLFITGYFCFGLIGVATIIDIQERAMFYPFMNQIRYLNVSTKPTFKEKMTRFVFQIPYSIDTRNLVIDEKFRVRKITLKEFIDSYLSCAGFLCFFVLQFLFYPNTITSDTLEHLLSSDALLQLFTVSLYVPMMIIPFGIFRTTDARIVSPINDFKLYDGFNSQVRHMLIQSVATTAVAVVLYQLSHDVVHQLVIVQMIGGFMLLTLSLSVTAYFVMMDVITISHVTAKWKYFMPVPLFESMNKNKLDNFLVGTPIRDESDVDTLKITPKE